MFFFSLTLPTYIQFLGVSFSKLQRLILGIKIKTNNKLILKQKKTYLHTFTHNELYLIYFIFVHIIFCKYGKIGSSKNYSETPVK